MRFVFDLDGVLRDINLPLGEKYGVPYPQDWWWKYKDKDIYQWMEEDKYKTIEDAPITEYMPVAKEYGHPIELWTCQPPKWMPHTEKWIENNIGPCDVHFLDTKEKRKRLDKFSDLVLIEDCPNFSSYDRIILIDMPYNKKVSAVRVKNADELRLMIKHYMVIKEKAIV